MRTVRASFLLALCFSFGPLHGQTTSVATIDSSYPVSVPRSSTVSFTTANITVTHPVGLTPGSYISGTQLNTDFQSFLTAYPTPTDPPEAILSTVLQAILTKYPQMTGGSLSGEIGGTYMGFPLPTAGGTVTVSIGSYNLAALGLARKPVAKPKPSPAN
jgi:hypothetical protein